MSAKNLIEERVRAVPEGEPFFPAQFLTVGSRASVDQVLSHLAKGGSIKRIARGIYVRPKQNKYVGEVLPGPEVIAKQVAASEGASIQVHGAEAARRFELTTQVPMQSVFYTNGRSREINAGRMKIRLVHRSPRRLAMAERPAGLALAALEYLGKHNVTPEVVDQVRRKLAPTEFEALRQASTAMPAWLAEALNRDSRLRAT
jgi:Family of unknown function (DUF6088)